MNAFGTPFMQHALLAGTGIGLAAGLVGYLAVLRAQVFLGDALGHVAFVGALAALLAGVAPLPGLIVATVGAGALLGFLGQGSRTGRGAAAEDTATGSLFAWLLGIGALLMSLYTTRGSAADSRGGVNVLFGSILGLSTRQAWTAAGIGLLIGLAALAVARPVLFATVDGTVAAARGVPVRLLAVGFAGLMGLCAAIATQAVGSLLLLGLIAAPGGAARALTARPYLGLALSAAIAVGSVWAGLALSVRIAQLPPSTAILAVAAGSFAAAHTVPRLLAPILAPSGGKVHAEWRESDL